MWLMIVLTFLWLLLAALGPRLLENPRGDVPTGLAYHAIRLYAFAFHRLRVEGLKYVPASRTPGPLVVVSNHTAGIDPLLIQAAVRFEVRFLMARDMQPRALAPVWRWLAVIPVARDAADPKAARTAIDFLRCTGQPTGGGYTASGVIGIFPEGGIERPAGTVMPFLPGVGLIVHRAGAPVLPVIVRGTPASATAWGSLTRRGRARVTFLPQRSYTASGLRPMQIAADLEVCIRAALEGEGLG